MASDSLDVKEDLCNYLQVIDSGKFATSGPLANASNPGLFVNGIGKVGLPLSERDAADLSRASHEAPFDKSSETFVDPTVCKTWELNPNQFELRNPAWLSTLHEVVGKVAQELGVVDGASGIRPELHKLLLYEPGAFFDKHRDTEKAPGMFATLVIALPSEHTGGDVVVQLKDEEQTLITQGLCDFGYSYLAWYADVNHSVSKVESGHRLVLTYNLIHQASNSSRVATVLDDHKQNLEKVLALWSKQDRDIESHSDYVYEKLVYILEHEYSEANICLDHLKGKDQLRARYLSEACRDQGFCLFFAHFEYSQLGSVDEDEDDPRWAHHSGAEYHEFIDELESNWKLLAIFQSDGQRLAEEIDLEEEDILENPDFTGIEPDDEECDGWTGNEGCTATHFYHRTYAVILPRTRRLDFLSEANEVSVKEYVDTLLREMQDETLSMASREELKRLCEMIIDAKKTPQKPRKESAKDSYSSSWQKEEPEIKGLSRVSDKELSFIGEAALRLDSPDLLEEFARVASRMLPLDIFQELGRGLVGCDMGLWQHGIKMAISHIPNIAERVKALDLLVSSYREAAGNSAAATQNLQDVERDIAMSMTETGSGDIALTAADADTLMQVSEKYGEKYIFQAVLPLVKKHTSNVDFTIAFLTGLFRAGEAEKFRLEVIQNLFKDILGDLIPDLNLHYRDVGREQPRNEWAKRRRVDYDQHGTQAADAQNPTLLTAESLATLFYSLQKLGLSHEFDQLTDQIISHATKANVVTFGHLLLPLLKQLLSPAEPGPESVGTYSYNKLFRTVLPSYINTYVQSPPQKPTHWEQQPRGCSLYCDDCVKLDAFLKSPDQPQALFSVNSKRRDHIQERLNHSYCSTETIRSGTPYTLVVKKTGMEWENAMKEWKQRCGVALKAIEDIGFEKLKGLLGEGWEDVVGLGGIKGDSGEERGERRPLGDLAQGKWLETEMGKKMAGWVGPEIIDLSGE